jgi:hypothetical protein
MNATTQTAPTARTSPLLADTIRLTKGDAEIVFVFADGRGRVQVDEDGAAVSWTYETAAGELVMRLRLGWQLAPVVAG